MTGMIRWLGVLGLVAMGALAAGCGGARVDGRTMANGPPGHFTIRNTSPFEICYIYMSPANYSQWGPDWLGARETLLNVSRTFDLNTGVYDIRFDDCQQHVIYQRWAVEIHDGDTLEFHESEIHQR